MTRSTGQKHQKDCFAAVTANMHGLSVGGFAIQEAAGTESVPAQNESQSTTVVSQNDA